MLPSQAQHELQALNRDANGYLLESSRQGAFLAIGVLAASPLWANQNGESPRYLILVAFIALLVSCLASVVVHFVVGHEISKSVQSIVGQVHGNLRGIASETHYIITKAWVVAGIQAGTAVIGFVLVVISLYLSVS